MKSKIKTLVALAALTSSTVAMSMSLAEEVAAKKAAKIASDLAVYTNYVPNLEDGEFADLGNRIYLKMTAPHYFKEGNSLAWKDENASYWKK